MSLWFIRSRLVREPISANRIEDGQTFLLLLGEKVGMRAGVHTSPVCQNGSVA
jgi:hypothetical protein